MKAWDGDISTDEAVTRRAVSEVKSEEASTGAMGNTYSARTTFLTSWNPESLIRVRDLCLKFNKTVKKLKKRPEKTELQQA